MKELVMRGDCSVAKELPRGKKTTQAERQSTQRLSYLIANKQKRHRIPKLKQPGTVAVRFSPAGNQTCGQIVFAKSSPLNRKLTPIKRGQKVTLVPKLEFFSPAQVSAAPHRAAERLSRAKFTREQRINAAHDKARKIKEQSK
jgi:hypothetical protein